jgi:S-adenosylmethionine:tRNA ribosyltransferase-isomerase
MRLADFDYELPDERIAQVPVEPRDSARLLVDRGAADPEHRYVRDLTDELRPGDLLVVNDSKVIPARLRLERASGGSAEVLLLEPLEPTRRHWEAMVRPARKLRVGERLHTSTGIELIEVGGRTAAGDTSEVTILGEGEPLDLLERFGEMPLPPYITTALPERDRYQTVYAAEPASAAAPTAGLHFTPELLDRIAAMGIETARVELVVGLDTFKPVSEDDPTQHQIHSERYRSDAAVHPSPVRLEGGRPADDQLPHAPHDAVADDRRVRGRAVAPPLRDGPRRGLPVSQLRRRNAARPAGLSPPARHQLSALSALSAHRPKLSMA